MEDVMQGRWISAAALVAVLLAGSWGMAQSQSPAPQGAWTMKKPLAAGPRNEVALASVNGKIYVVGGSIDGKAVPLVDEYDPATDTWRSRAPMPKGLDHLGVAVLN